ncbi:DASS family sodium-coupled anion symporter [Candidatus Fermentibacteria bacterium]|nr:DASS family sodium-coupled anion symporter [Candidatus Fermentibacteria bacterium]
MHMLDSRNTKALVILAAALAAGLVVGSLRFSGLGQAGRITLGIFTVAAILWMLEPFPLYVTSFLVLIMEVVLLTRPGAPLALAGKSYRIFVAPFFDPVIVLLLGGFTMATAVKRCGIDEMISRQILQRMGTGPGSVLLGMMVTSAFLSMWLSNTATAALMLAVAIPLVESLPKGERFGKAIVLGIPFACNVGGMATPIGTPPNAIAMGILDGIGSQITFLEWMMRGVPLVVVLLVLCWLVLMKIFKPGVDSIEVDLGVQDRMDGRTRFVLILFSVVVLLWLTTKWHGIPSPIVSLLPLVVLFGLRILNDDDLRNLGWGVLFIVGGGMSLGVAMRESGLTEWLVELVPFGGIGLLPLMLVFSVGAAAITTFISNSATANLLIPIVVGITAISPDRSAVIIALASSVAMMLPISTPPNAIAYGSGYLRMNDMLKAGSVITFASSIMVAAFIYMVF